MLKALILSCLIAVVFLPTATESLAFEKSQETTLTLFWAEWDPHSKQMRPEWDRAAQKCGGQFREIEAQDIGENMKIGGFQIRGFPTILLIRNGEVVSEYRGDRSAESLCKFLKGKRRSLRNRNRQISP